MAPLRPEWAAAMALAITQAQQAGARGEVPVGAVVLGADDSVLACAGNEREARADPTAHAEILALRAAAGAPGHEADGWRLSGCTVVVTLEPCAMCAGAMVAARVQRCVFGAWDDKAGACGSVWDLARDPASLHRIEIVGGVAAEASAGLLREFFGRGGGA